MCRIAIITRDFFKSSRLDEGVIICWTGGSKFSYLLAKKLAELSRKMEIYLFSFEETNKPLTMISQLYSSLNNLQFRPIYNSDKRKVHALLFDIFTYARYSKFQSLGEYEFLLRHWQAFKYPGLSVSLSILESLLEDNFDVIYIVNPLSTFTLASHMIKDKGASIKIALQPLMHEGLIRSRYFQPLMHMFRSFDAITVSTPYEEMLLRNSKMKNVYFVGEGVDLNYIKTILSLGKGRLDETLLDEISQADYKTLWIGRKFFYKGFYHTLLAFNKLLRKLKSHGLSVKLISLGEYPKKDIVPKSIREKVLRVSAKLQEDKKLIDLGVVSEQTKYALMSICDFIVLPSREETIPLVFLEGWSFKKAVIGANIPTVASVITKQGDGGLLIPFGDIDKLTDSMHKLCTNDEYRRECGEKGFRKVREIYNMDSVAKRVMDHVISKSKI